MRRLPICLLGALLLSLLVAYQLNAQEKSDGSTASSRTFRPVVRGTQYAVSSMKQEATRAAARILASGGNAFDAFPGAWREQMLAHASAALREMDQMIRPYPTRAAIRSIACPVTVIEGDLSDPAFARAVGFVMRLLPQARLVSLPGAAHMLHFDQPESWVEVVTQTTGHAPSPVAVPSPHPQ